MNTIKPLCWPDNWTEGLPKSRWRRFWLGKVALFGSEYKAERFINKQLKKRDYDACLSRWKSDDMKVLGDFREIVKRWFNRANQNFIPEDPFQIIFFDAMGFSVDDARVDAFSDMEAIWDISVSDFHEWQRMTLGEVFNSLKEKSRHCPDEQPR